MKTSSFTPDPEEVYLEFPDLKYYHSGEDYTYFDATYYLGKNDPTGQRNVDDFLTKFDYQINAICDSIGLDRERLILADEATGSTMVYEALEFLFIAYVDVWYCKYVYERLRELHSLGFSVSDSYLIGLYKQRFQLT